MHLRILITTLILVTTTLVLLFFSQQDKESLYLKGNSILEREGATAAYDFFSEAVRQSGNPKALFGTAWSEFINGNLAQAESTCRYLLAESQEPLVRAHSHYLLGYLTADTNRTRDAFHHFSRAYSMYQDLDKDKNMFNATLGLARVSIDNQDATNAETFLEQARIISLRCGTDLAFYHVLSKKLAVLHRDYPAALQHAKQAYDLYELADNRPGMASALNNIAFFLLIMGQDQEGLIQLERATRLLDGISGITETQYNNVCRALYNKCHDLPYLSLQKEVEDWLLEHPLNDLSNFLDLVMASNCP